MYMTKAELAEMHENWRRYAQFVRIRDGVFAVLTGIGFTILMSFFALL